ncbi:hypothetical protein GCM10010284_22300 [Streptomyces rubiginosohelvolus]|uniref:Secreted protein n=1 Tax=Streptomyces rubiginosohelvolus TaxID=67362 RepID=A0ABQ3BFD8_9ACTN|nr:hypothetical protein GCM10010284_22300 [Streptomyces rubiginosohelvolus]GGZ41804.1 hypothetical protein GCM10010328_14510 [Streptomyces pluricolorescens]
MPCPTTTIVGTAVCAWAFGVAFEAAAVVRGSKVGSGISVASVGCPHAPSLGGRCYPAASRLFPGRNLALSDRAGAL